MRRYQLIIVGLIISVFSIVTPFVKGQSELIRAEVDQKELSTDQHLSLTVTLFDVAQGQPKLPVLADFEIINSSSSTQFTVVNGVSSSQATYRYLLRPLRIGRLEIGAITIEQNGVVHQSDPIEITVVQGAVPTATVVPPVGRLTPAAGLNGQDLYVEADVSNPTPYIGEPISYIFRFYQAVNLAGQPRYSDPEMNGFWVQADIKQNQSQTVVAGRTYLVTELRQIIFPTVLGELVIEPAALVLPGSFFQAGERMPSNRVAVNVQPLPAGEPVGFSGVVGEGVMITATVDLEQTKVNEPINLKIVVAGAGNVENWANPTLPELDGWRTFESKSNVSSSLKEGKVQGQRTYEQLLVPTRGGALTIPSIVYHYFDPTLEEYRTVRSEPIVVTVEGEAEEVVVGGVDQGTTAVERIDLDIRHIKPVSEQLVVGERGLVERPLYWIGWLLPLLLIAVLFGKQKYEAYQEANPILLRRNQAKKKAESALRAGGDVRVELVLFDYLSAKLDMPAQGMTRERLVEALTRLGVREGLVNRLNQLFVASELARYAPGAGKRSGLIEDGLQIIIDLENELKGLA